MTKDSLSFFFNTFSDNVGIEKITFWNGKDKDSTYVDCYLYGKRDNPRIVRINFTDQILIY